MCVFQQLTLLQDDTIEADDDHVFDDGELRLTVEDTRTCLQLNTGAPGGEDGSKQVAKVDACRRGQHSVVLRWTTPVGNASDDDEAPDDDATAPVARGDGGVREEVELIVARPARDVRVSADEHGFAQVLVSHNSYY